MSIASTPGTVRRSSGTSSATRGTPSRRSSRRSLKTAGIDFGKLLPILAPIVLGLIAKKQGGAAGQTGSGRRRWGVGDIIGGLLGGGPGSPAGVDIGGLLGGLFGEKK